jgi:hypothetical protein
MSKNFPPIMIEAAKLGKMSFLSDITSNRLTDCKNCGGMGNLYLFIASEGPYREPANPYRGDNKSSKFHDGKWWIGETHAFQCPDCRGTGEAKQFQGVSVSYRNTQPIMQGLTKDMET